MPYMSKNTLYYGDNLQVLREHIKDESVDLIYLDPPFNSKATYNVLFRSADTKEQSHSQIAAFEDTWHWGHEAQLEYNQIIQSMNLDLAELIQALRKFLKESDMMAYLVMMANRLVELHRVLKPTGSLYLHCDPTASHYLKLLLDAIFGFNSFKNEIIWHYNTGGKGKRTFLRKHDVIFFYSKTKDYIFNRDIVAIPRKVGTAHLRHGVDEEGREYYEDFSPRKSGKQYRWYLDEGLTPMDVWTDIQAINPSARERLGYPTQKPLSLLERIIQASSNEGDIVLDPFCGCGTAIHAAQKLNRNWIGIDITHLAISLIEKRLKDAFPDLKIEVEGTPKDFEAAKDLSIRDKYQFQWWAVSLVNGIPFQGKKKGADSGIDGIIYFDDGEGSEGKYGKIVISVKGGEHINVGMVRDLKGTIEREKAAFGLFITLAEPTEPMLKEASAAALYASKLYPSRAYPTIQILTVEGLLNGTQRPEYPNTGIRDIGLKSIGKEVKTPKQADLF